MVNPQPRQYTAPLVNVIGVNNMGAATRPQATGLQLPNNPQLPVQEPTQPKYAQIPDVTNEKFQNMAQDSETRYQLVKQAMEAQAGVRQAAIAARGMPQRQAELAGIFDSIASAGLKYLEYEKEKEAQKEDLERQRNAMMARAALEEIGIDAQSRVRQYGDENGIYTTREDMRRVLELYSQVLPPEEMVPLYQFYGTEMRELETRASTRYYEAAQEQKNAQVNLVKATLNYQLSSVVGSLTNPALNQQQTDALFSQAFDTIIQGTQGLDPTQRLQILGDVLTPIANSATVTAGQRAAVEQRLADLQWFIPYVENEIRPQYGDDPTQFKYALWMSAPESLRDLMGDIPNNADLQRQIASELGTQAEIQAYYRNQQREQMFAQGVQPAYVKTGLELAYRMMTGDANALAQLGLLQSREKSELAPHEIMALQYYEQWTDYSEQYEQLRSQLNAADVALAGRIKRFPAGSVPQTTTYVDAATGEAYLLQVQNEDGSAVFVNQNLTPEQREAAVAEVQATNAERQRIQNQVQQLLQTASASGFDLTNRQNHSYLDMIYTDLDNQAASEAFGSTQQTVDPSGNPNFGFQQVPNGPAPAPGSPNAWRAQPHQDLSGFNWSANEPPPGYPSGQSPVAPLARSNGIVIPFSHTRNGEITISSEYGMRTSPTSGQYRLHAGVDFASGSMYDDDVGAVTPAGGHVLAAFDWNGYGGTVLVQTPEGYVEQYSHLRRFFAKPGDYIQPGQPVGVVGGGSGDPMPGGSTGRHLHFQVWKPGVTEYTNPTDDTLDPLTYLEQVPTYETTPRSTGPVPGRPHGAQSYMPAPNALPDGRGNWYGSIDAERYPYLTRFLQQGGGMEALAQVPVERVYQPSAPVSSGQMSSNRDSYPGQNNPNHNYGYQTIARDPEFARALAEVSDELGIPAVWLADLMWVESNHDPRADGPETWLGRGYGMLQIMSGGKLAEWGISPSEVQAMSPGEQLRSVIRRYLLPFKGQMNDVVDLVNAVREGTVNPGTDNSQTSDGWTTRNSYIDRMGAVVGRRYGRGGDFRSVLGQTHESYNQGCPYCDQQINRYNAIIPHEAP